MTFLAFTRTPARPTLAFAALLALGFLCVSATSSQGADGTWERAWGKNVDAVGGSGGAEICTVAANCQAGTTSTEAGGEMDHPPAVAVDAAGNVYVADELNNRIQKFDSLGNFERAWGKDVDTGVGAGFEICTVAANCKEGVAGGMGGEMDHPSGVATLAGKVYVVEGLGHRVQKFDSLGNFERAWGKDVDTGGGTGFETCAFAGSCKTGETGGLKGEMSSPSGIATDVGNVYVADSGNDRIQNFDSSGTFQRAWGGDVNAAGGTDFETCTAAQTCKAGVAGGLGGEMNFPNSVASNGTNIYVADFNNYRVQMFDVAGGFVRTWGKDVSTAGGTGFEPCTSAGSCKTGVAGGLGGEMNRPTGVATSGGDLYVAEFDNQRIQRFDSLGNFERAWGKDVVSGGGTGFEICTSAAACQLGSSGAKGGELAAAFGVATDSAGNVYVADRDNNRIQKFADPVPDQPTPTPTTPPPAGPIYGTPGNDILQGTPGNDVIFALAGNDKVYGNGGDDLIIGGKGNDKLFGLDGNDTLKGGAGTDKCVGGNGTDIAKKCEKVRTVP